MVVFIVNSNRGFQYGRKINENAGSTHIEGLRRLVLEKKLDFGAAFDGDGDRCLLIDSLGELVDGDQILAIIAKYLLIRISGGRWVLTSMF